MQLNNSFCPLCLRPLAPPTNKHHLLPVSQGGKGTVTVELHKICHDKIHSVLSEKEIAKQFYTIPLLIQNEEIKKFLTWIKKQPENYYDKSFKIKK